MASEGESWNFPPSARATPDCNVRLAIEGHRYVYLNIAQARQLVYVLRNACDAAETKAADDEPKAPGLRERVEALATEYGESTYIHNRLRSALDGRDSMPAADCMVEAAGSIDEALPDDTGMEERVHAKHLPADAPWWVVVCQALERRAEFNENLSGGRFAAGKARGLSMAIVHIRKGAKEGADALSGIIERQQKLIDSLRDTVRRNAGDAALDRSNALATDTVARESISTLKSTLDDSDAARARLRDRVREIARRVDEEGDLNNGKIVDLLRAALAGVTPDQWREQGL